MKKKILIIIGTLEKGGGAEKVATDLTNQLSKNYDISLLSLDDCENRHQVSGKYYTLQENIISLSKFIKTSRLYLIPRFLRIFKLINKISPDIIISFMDLTNITSILIKLIFNIKIPLIVCVHTNPKLAYKENLKYLNNVIKILYSLKSTNKIVTISKTMQDIMELDYKIRKNKLKTIYNGIDIKRIKELSEKKIEDYKLIFETKELIKFITVGRLVELKAHDFLIKTFNNVKKIVPNSKLLIIGHGPLKKDLQTLINNLNLKDDVFLLGYKKNPFKYIANSDIFVLSSKYEGLPMVLLEALTCEIPIISTNCETGPKEILDYNKFGFLVDVMNSKELAEKMVYLAKNPEILKNYSKKSAQRAKFFDFEKIRTDWIDLIEKLTSYQ
ncbi:MAG: glycosyltransferase [Promethearchaeota archaeon]